LAHREQDGTVRFEAQNLRVLAALVSDDDEYEYYRTIRRSHVPQLIEMLGARAGDDLRNLLAHAWSEDRSFELEAMFRAPLAMAREKGVATPTLDLLVALCTLKLRAAGMYP